MAILSYGQGAGPWELENYAVNRSSWSNSGYSGYPNPSPPDSTMLAGSKRYSTLPMGAIRDAINSAGIGVDAWIDNNGPGAFLCAYMAYHDMWYQSLHSSESDPYRCIAAGFTHVSGSLTPAQAIAASDIALRATIDYVDSVIPAPEPATIALLGLGVLALLRKRSA